MQLKTILCNFGRICATGATGNALLLQETILCEFGRIRATGNAFVRLPYWEELHFECSRQNVNRNVKSPSTVMTHHSAKANLDKGFSWPLEAIPYGLYLRVDF